ncbi:IS110 family transposase [Actinokineospora inagensis]|uniref:IS110 family transposase n=1 Tax=Actinokineospora inagensis TaxID=103730 RepID=UPI0003FC7115
MTLFCGTDWAESHHDVAIINDAGTVVAKARIGDDAAGFTRLLDLPTGTGDTGEAPVPMGIETDRRLLVAALRATSPTIYAINRCRRRVTGPATRFRARSDAVLSTNIVHRRGRAPPVACRHRSRPGGAAPGCSPKSGRPRPLH